MTMVIIYCVGGAAVSGWIFLLCIRGLIRDTMRWEPGTRAGTIAAWCALALATYIIVGAL